MHDFVHLTTLRYQNIKMSIHMLSKYDWVLLFLLKNYVCQKEIISHSCSKSPCVLHIVYVFFCEYIFCQLSRHFFDEYNKNGANDHWYPKDPEKRQEVMFRHHWCRSMLIWPKFLKEYQVDTRLDIVGVFKFWYEPKIEENIRWIRD